MNAVIEGTKPAAPDKAEMLRALRVLYEPGDLIECRILHKGRKKTSAGYYQLPMRSAMADAAVKYNRQGHAAYIQLNRIDPQLLGRYSNRMEDWAEATATDKDVIRRRWILIDVDPARPKDTSSSDQQLQWAMEKAGAVKAWLAGQGWPAPVEALSGNGYHLLYRIDLPNTPEVTEAVKNLLLVLAGEFNTTSIKIDTSVFNAGRVVKMYGSLSTKGDNTALNPWRLSRLVAVPEQRVIVSLDQIEDILKKLARHLPKPTHPPGQTYPPVKGNPPTPYSNVTPFTGKPFDLVDFLARLGIEYTQDSHDGRTRYKLKHCPFNPEHGYTESAIFQSPDGKLGFKCQHDSCADKTWQDVRALVDGQKESRNYGKAENRNVQNPSRQSQSGVCTSEDQRPEPPPEGVDMRALHPPRNRENPVPVATPDNFDPKKAVANAEDIFAKAAAGRFHGTDYPVQCLGPLLGPAAVAVAQEGQLDVALAGQSFLAAASVLAQAMANVKTMNGTKPLSCYFLTIGSSGDGKSTADDSACRPISDWQRAEGKVYAKALERHKAEEGKKKGKDFAEEQAADDAPMEPWIIMRDPTVEGIRRGFEKGRSSQGVFTSEGGAILSGYGMGADQRRKTCATYSGIWDNGEVSVSRAIAGRIQLYGKRLSLHWMVQPAAALSSVQDPTMVDMGFWPRFIFAWPSPPRPRIMRPYDPASLPAVARVWDRFKVMLREPVRDDCGTLPAIAMTQEAEQGPLRTFFEYMEEEAEALSEKSLVDIRPFAIRASELVYRVAGIIAITEGKGVIDADSAERATLLVTHSLRMWQSLSKERDAEQAEALALLLFRWMCSRGGLVTETEILQRAPARLRNADAKDRAIAELRLRGLIGGANRRWAVL